MWPRRIVEAVTNGRGSATAVSDHMVIEQLSGLERDEVDTVGVACVYLSLDPRRPGASLTPEKSRRGV